MLDLTESFRKSLRTILEPTTPAAAAPAAPAAAAPASDSPPAPPAPAAGKRKRPVAPRRRKEALLAQIAQLALEGHNGRTIAEQVGVPTRTVNYLLQELRQEWIAKAGNDAAATCAVTVARLESIYRTAMEEWRRSQTDKEVRLVEDSGPAGDEGGAKTKKSTRTEARMGNAAFLAKAIDAAKEIYRLRGRCAPPSSAAASPTELRVDWRTFTRNEWRHLSRKDFAALNARMQEIEAEEAEEIADAIALAAAEEEDAEAEEEEDVEAADAEELEAAEETTNVTPPPN